MIDIDWNPPPRDLRIFGTGLIVFGGVMAGLMAGKGSPGAALAFGLLAALGAFVVLFPERGRPVYRAWMTVAFVIGTVVATALLGMLYFVVMTPLALAFRLSGRDSLELKPRRRSMWRRIETPAGKSRFERLY